MTDVSVFSFIVYGRRTTNFNAYKNRSYLIYRPDQQTRPTDQTRPPVLKCRPTRPDHARRLVITYGMIKRLMHFNDPFNAHINGAHTWYMIYDGSCYLMPFCTTCECTCQHKHVVMMISIASLARLARAIKSKGLASLVNQTHFSAGRLSIGDYKRPATKGSGQLPIPILF